jgi:hypothetical protein
VRVTSDNSCQLPTWLIEQLFEFTGLGVWHAACLTPDMQSQVIALLVPTGCRQATLLVRRGDGQFALEGIDARVASATRVAANWFRQGSVIYDASEVSAA